MFWRKFATELIVAELLIIFVFIIWLWRISGGYSQEMMGLVLAELSIHMFAMKCF